MTQSVVSKATNPVTPVSSTGVEQAINADGSADVKTSSNSTWSYGSWPEDRHDPQSGVGTNAADIHFQTTDSTNFNEHMLEVTAGVVDLTLALNDGSAYRGIFVEDMNVANPSGTEITSIGLVVGIYHFIGSYHSIKVAQNGAAASASDLASFCK